VLSFDVTVWWDEPRNCWVLDHADDYSWSIVGEPSGRYLWILSRQTQPAEATVQQLVERAAGLGYDTSMLVRTTQP
jgi:apolipoprotein D and lipocalin family protein